MNKITDISPYLTESSRTLWEKLNSIYKITVCPNDINEYCIYSEGNNATIFVDSTQRPCAASWPNAGKEPKNIDYLCNTYFPIIDEIGIEPLINDFGEKYEGFNRVLNIAEQRLKPVFVSTNLTPEQMLARYDVRTIDRLVRLSKMVKFEGRSYRK